MTRFLCLDFETVGFPEKNGAKEDLPLPFTSFPIQVSVHSVEDGQIQHAYTSLIKGAERLTPWVRANVPVTLESLEFGKTLPEVVTDLAGLLREGDTIVAHNARFDLHDVLATACSKTGYDSAELRRILAAPRFCTMTCAYSKRIWSKWPSMDALCAHFEVVNPRAHDASSDTAALAQCVAEALRRGVMLTEAPGETHRTKAPQGPSPRYAADMVGQAEPETETDVVFQRRLH
jgi:DNA polymerase III epsilon subunit-like protein